MTSLRENVNQQLWPLVTATRATFAGLFDPEGLLLAGVPETTHCPDPALLAGGLDVDPAGADVLISRRPNRLLLALACRGWARPPVLGLWLLPADAALPLDEIADRLTAAGGGIAKALQRAAGAVVDDEIPRSLPPAVRRLSDSIEAVVVLGPDGLVVAASGPKSERSRVIGRATRQLSRIRFAQHRLPTARRTLPAASFSPVDSIAWVPLGAFLLAAVSRNPADANLIDAALRAWCGPPTAAEAPLPPPSSRLICSINGTTFHHPWCGQVHRIRRHNRRWLQSRGEAVQQDLLPCPYCEPHRDDL